LAAKRAAPLDGVAWAGAADGTAQSRHENRTSDSAVRNIEILLER
jgi:hypothetical protein